MSPLHCPGPKHQAHGAKSGGCLTTTFSEAQKRTEMLRHPCVIGGPQPQARGTKSEVAASPLLSRSPKRGRKCYVTPPFLGVPYTKRKGLIQKSLPHLYFLGGPKEGGNGTSPLHCPGSPTPSGGGKLRSSCLTLTFSGAQKRAEILCHPCIVRSPRRQAQGTKLEVDASPLLSWGPKRGRKCYVTLAFSGDPQPQVRGAKREMAASPLLSRRPKRGRKCYVTPAFSGVPNAKRGEQNRKWLPHHYFLGGPKEVEMPRHPCIVGGPQHQAQGAKRSATPRAGSKIRSGCLTPTLSGAQERAEMLRHPCNLRGPQRQAQGAN